MNLDYITYFATVFETGSCRKAAAKLYVSAQAVSKGIRRFSEELGQPLFDHVGQKMIPTKYARSIYPEARRIMWDLNSIVYKASAGSESVPIPKVVTLGIGCMPGRCVSITQNQVNLLKERFPETRFELTYCSNESCFLSLEKGLFDACIVCGSYSDSTPTFIRLRVDAPDLVMSARNPLADCRLVRLADLSGKPVAQTSDRNYYYLELMSAFEREGIDPPVFANRSFLLDEFAEYLQAGGVALVDSKTIDVDSLFPGMVIREVDKREFPSFAVSFVFSEEEGAEWKQFLGSVIERRCYS